MKIRFGYLGIGGDEGEHRGHVRVDHPAPFRHPADADRLLVNKHFNRHLLRERVGGENRLSGVQGLLVRGIKGLDDRSDPFFDRFHRQRKADHSGGAYQRLLCLNAEVTGDEGGARRASRNPFSPVAALALPLLTNAVDRPARFNHL